VPRVSSTACVPSLALTPTIHQGLLYVSCRWFDTRSRHLKSIMEGLTRDVHDGTEPFAAGARGLLNSVMEVKDRVQVSGQASVWLSE
jgi:hypothetical protein